MLRDISDRFYNYFPKFSDYEVPRTKANDRVTKYIADSRSIIGTAGNVETGRGGTYNIIHGTEVAFWKDAEKILTGAMQGGDPQIILESTANGNQGYFYELCIDALSGRNDWNLIFIPYTKFTEYNTEGWLEQKKKELGSFFTQEYPTTVEEAFIASGTGYFSDIEIDYSAPMNTNHIPNHIYSGGIDWGQSNDYTVATIIDRTDNRQVDYIRLNKLPWAVQRNEIVKLYRKWHLNSSKAEANSMGSTNIEELRTSGLVVESFTTSNSSKSLIMNKLHKALEGGLKLIDCGVQKLEFSVIESKQTPTGLWTISAPNGQHDDFVMVLH